MKHNLLKSVIISVILLMGVSNAWGASPIYSIGDVYVTGSMNGWSTNSSNWKLGSGNHCTKTFYLEESETNYTFKLYLKSGYYTADGYWFTKTTSGPAYSLSTSGDDMQIETKNINAASGYIKLDFDFWGEYSGDSKLSVTQSAVAALSPSLSANKTALIAAEKSTITASCSGGSGSYTYTYKVTCNESDVTSSTLSATTGASVTFTAPSSVTGKKTYTITVTAKDSHALLSELATKTATKTITVEEAHNVTVSYKYGSTTIKDNTTTNNVKYETASSITAPTIDGYKFANWTLGNGITNKSDNTTTNPISITTKSSGTYTLTANYTEDLTSTWHIVGKPTSIFHGAEEWAAHNDNMLKKTTGASTASKGSLTIDVKTLPVNNDSYQFKVLNTNGTKWYGWSDQDYYWMNDTKTTNVYNADDHNLYFIPNALGEYKFDVDWSSSNPSLKVTFPTAYTVTFGKGTGGSSITAKYNSTSFNSGTKVQQGKTVTFTQSASTGYTFKEWNTKSDGKGTTLSTNATYTHTVTTSNNVYAVYTQNPDRVIYLEPTGFWDSNNPQYVAHVWGSGEANIVMTGIGEAPYKYYSCAVPAKYTDVVFYRKSSDGTTIWNQTADLKLPNKSTALYEIKSTGDKTPGQDGYIAATGEWKDANLVYTVTIGESKFGPFGISYNGQSYYSKANGDVTVVVPHGASINFIEGQPHSDIYTGDIMEEGVTRQFDLTQPYTVQRNITFKPNYVTKVAQVAYLGVPNNSNWDKNASYANFTWRFDSYGSFTMTNRNDKAEFAFEANNIKYYKFTIPAGCNKFQIQRKLPKSGDDESNGNSTYSNTGDHEYMVLNAGINCYMVGENTRDTYYTGYWCELPANTGDYRLLYVEQKVEKQDWKTVITRIKEHPSNIVRKHTTDGEHTDIVSLHVYRDKLVDGKTCNPEVILQQYQLIDQQYKWVDIEAHMVNGPLETDAGMAMLPGRRNASSDSDVDDFVYDNGIEVIKNDEKPGRVWNFTIQQTVNNSNTTATLLLDENNLTPYEGKYYIRTNNAEGGWSNYTNLENQMTFSQYAKENSGYSHYFCKWVTTSSANVKFIVANDLGIAISEEFAKDDFTAEDGVLKEDANVRWMWNEETNECSRAYIQGAYNGKEQNENIVLDYTTDGTHDSGTDLILKDQGDWVYQIDVPNIHKGSTLTSLTAVYPKGSYTLTYTAGANKGKEYTISPNTQIFAESIEMILAEAADNTYKVRIMYDFKINKTLIVLIPNEGITNETTVGIDLLIERTNQGDANQVTTQISTTKEDAIVYGVLNFTKEHLLNENLSEQERLTYWISFPFDVKIGDIFGFGEVGKYWMVKYYDGAERAQKGWFLETKTFWKFFTNTDSIMKANTGYALVLNKKLMNEACDAYANNPTTLSLYFPSTTTINSIDQNLTTTTCTIPEHYCKITSPEDRTIKDSHWNFIGVPSYAEHTKETSNTNVKYFYDYDFHTDKYTTEQNTGNRTFKPMRAYMVQFAGTIDWSTLTMTHVPDQLAAKKNANGEQDTYNLRLELQQNGVKADQTFVELQDDDATAQFDMNIDLTKIINAGANIYTIISTNTVPVQAAGNALPIANTVIPVGVQIATAGEYTFAMPDGTDGIVVELIDYETNIRTNLMLDEYTVNLAAGTNEARFALHVKPNKVTTSLEDGEITTTNGKVRKFLIDGVLYLQKDGNIYDAQGKLIR